jgi:hypothetical protein
VRRALAGDPDPEVAARHGHDGRDRAGWDRHMGTSGRRNLPALPEALKAALATSQGRAR